MDENARYLPHAPPSVTLLAIPSSAHVGPQPENGIAFDQHPGAHVPADLTFLNAQGAHETLGDAIAHKPTVLLLGYLACKDLCAVTLPATAKALDRAGLW